MPQQSGPCFVMAPNDAAAKREIERLQAEYGDGLPKALFVMTLADREVRGQ